jgi:glycosyltransferase involved in cell wall biosynthesis
VTALNEVWICPPLDGPSTGGTLYNARIIDALASCAVRVTALGLEEGRRALRAGASGRYWIDSLLLDHVGRLVRENTALLPLGLVVHYLPSLVALGRVPRRSELSAAERAALELVRHFLAPSAFSRDVLVELGVSSEAIVVVEPGVDGHVVAASSCSRAPRSFLSAVMVANVVAGKGVAPFLRALAPLSDGVPFELTVIGSLKMDDAYASECRRIVEGSAALFERVHFVGPMPHQAVLDSIPTHDLLISASRMESYGMALAEARAAGMPILSRGGGNAAAHVGGDSGGELVVDDAALAGALVRLAREPNELRRRALVAASARRARTWGDAASDFIEQLRARV